MKTVPDVYTLRVERTSTRLAGLVLRGGSWANNDNNVRAANRNNNNPNNFNNNIGFRVVVGVVHILLNL